MSSWDAWCPRQCFALNALNHAVSRVWMALKTIDAKEFGVLSELQEKRRTIDIEKDSSSEATT